MRDHVYTHLGKMLIDYGVECVFGMRIYHELDLSRIRHINMHHETSAALMACGYARVSGKPGVITLNRAGIANAITGMAEAFNSSIPIIVLQDGLSINLQGKNALYELDHLSIERPVTKWIGDVVDLATAPAELRKAFRIATTGRPGPVVLNVRGVGSIFHDYQWIEAEPSVEPEYASFPAQRIRPAPESIERAVEVLKAARQPCILAGGGVNLSRAWAELRELAELGQFPVATTIAGKGAFAEKHPLSAGPVGRLHSAGLGRGRVAEKIVKDSDVVLLVGTRTNELATSAWKVPDPRSTLIHLDVDPAEIGRNYNTSVGIVADAKAGLQALTDALRASGFQPPEPRTEEIRSLMDVWRRDNDAISHSDATPIHPARLVREVADVLGPDTILVADASTAYVWATSHTFVEAGPTFIAPRGTGAIGTGLPLAIGTQLAAPDKRVICFEGDGGIMTGILPELETAARYDVPVVTIVFNNGTMQLERDHIRQYRNWQEFDLSPNLDFAAMARELKCEGIRIEHPSEIGPALQTALTSTQPTLLDVVLDPEQGFPSGH
ncbi:MAG TPA: thiamine pyrophosphate-binding protein [Chloroflexota bacterium]